MFKWKRKAAADKAKLEERIKELEAAVARLQIQVELFRVGKLNIHLPLYTNDYRPTVSIKEAIKLILDKLHLTFTCTPAVPAITTIVKRPK